MAYQKYILDNGLKIIHKKISNGVAHCGLIINAATRDENDDENGIAHFIEHMIFKGTKKRKPFHILSRMENVGGELNAYTSKEETSIYASFIPQYYERAIELIYDITFHSVFPEKEIKKEKDVVIDEINSYRDNPSEEIYDDFENLLFDGHPMGKNILGTRDQVKGFNRGKIVEFIHKNYLADQMVIASVGNIDFNKLKKLCEKYFLNIPNKPRKIKRNPFENYQSKTRIESKNVFLSHGCIGNIAFSMHDKKRLPMVLLNNILGGPGMNSRLNLGVREKYGFTYSIDSQYMPYTDTGVFSIYLGTDKGYMEKSIELVHKELKKLRSHPLGVLQLKRAKQQLIGQLAISFESNLNEMLSVGRAFLHLGHVKTFTEVCQKINLISSTELTEVAEEVFAPGNLSTLIFKSNNNLSTR